jgi:hypothetical protein
MDPTCQYVYVVQSKHLNPVNTRALPDLFSPFTDDPFTCLLIISVQVANKQISARSYKRFESHSASNVPTAAFESKTV